MHREETFNGPWFLLTLECSDEEEEEEEEEEKDFPHLQLGELSLAEKNVCSSLKAGTGSKKKEKKKLLFSKRRSYKWKRKMH